MENKIQQLFENAETAVRDLLIQINNIPAAMQGADRICAANELISGLIRKYQNCVEFPLPCAHQIDRQVILHFGISGSVAYAWVKNVKFTPAPVYDLDILISKGENGEKDNYTRIYGVGSAFVSSVN